MEEAQESQLNSRYFKGLYDSVAERKTFSQMIRESMIVSPKKAH